MYEYSVGSISDWRRCNTLCHFLILSYSSRLQLIADYVIRSIFGTDDSNSSEIPSLEI